MILCQSSFIPPPKKEKLRALIISSVSSVQKYSITYLLIQKRKIIILRYVFSVTGVP